MRIQFPPIAILYLLYFYLFIYLVSYFSHVLYYCTVGIKYHLTYT